MQSYFSPAKLNLFFRVLGKRSDGYHDIASLYQAINEGDRLFLEPSSQDRLTCSDPTLSCNEENLVWKALQLFRAHVSFPAVHLHLEKRIPIQAGLGGGSSNAATTLWALNQWAKRPYSTDQLAALGREIGSDVAFFFSSGTAYCTGRGEKVEPVSIQPFSGWIAKPAFGLSTPQVYRAVCLEELPLVDPRAALEQCRQGKPLFFNDLEGAASRIEPRVWLFKERLLSCGYFKTVVMTGSGSSFFCLGEDPPPAWRGISFTPFRSLQRDPIAWYRESSS